MDDARLLAVLHRMNTWWDGNGVPTSLKKATHRRRDFYRIRDAFQDTNTRQVWTLRGPRQVGKTTLCGQLIETLLSDWDVPPEHILYISLENSQVQSDPENTIRDSLEVFEQFVLEHSLRHVDHRLFVFIDEVQKAPRWASTLKYFTDTYETLQFFTTGSVSTLIKRDASETLVGRLKEQVMMPLKFIDHVRYHDQFPDTVAEDRPRALRESLRASVNAGEMSEFSAEAAQFYGLHDDLRPALNAQKDDYLLRGGYPGMLDLEMVDVHGALDTDLQYTISGDLTSVFDVNKPEKVFQILHLVADSAGSKVSKSSMANTAGISRGTVDQYLEYLEEFFLTMACPRYATSAYETGGRQKLYIQDVGLYNTIMGSLAEDTLANPVAMGSIIETAVCDHAKRLQFNFSGGQNTDIAYWDQNGEVDFVLDGPGYVLPIEVKRGDSTTEDLRGLHNFLDETNAAFGIAVNDAGQLKESGQILHIPLWLFLFLC